MTIHTLEQQLADLIRKHDLTGISINASTSKNEGETYFYCYAHGGSEVGTSGYDYPLIHDALSAAISNLNAKRHPVVAVELAPMGEAA
jgi:hypothetical protein